MNILFFTYDFPYPTTSGGKSRAYNLLKFGKKNAKITLVSFTRESFDRSSIKKMEEIGIDDVVLFPRKKLLSIRNFASVFSKQSLLRRLYFDKSITERVVSIVRERNIDLIHFESFYTGVYIDPVFSDISVKQVYGSENIEYKLYEDQAKYASSVKKAFFQGQVERLKHEEADMYRHADATITVTDSERTYVRSITEKPCYVIPNGINPAEFEIQKKSDGQTLLFIGNFTYFPNIDGMQFFISRIFGQLPKNVRLVVVGKNASKLSFLNYERVIVYDHITNISEAYAQATVFVSPMRVGGGTNFKVLEAMASGVPVVALQDRIHDFGFTDGKEILVAKNPEEFVRKTTKLLGDVKAQRSIAVEARKAVATRYNWQMIGEELHEVWKKVLS